MDCPHSHCVRRPDRKEDVACEEGRQVMEQYRAINGFWPRFRRWQRQCAALLGRTSTLTAARSTHLAVED
jgi:hypothetical protein